MYVRVRARVCLHCVHRARVYIVICAYYVHFSASDINITPCENLAATTTGHAVSLFARKFFARFFAPHNFPHKGLYNTRNYFTRVRLIRRRCVCVRVCVRTFVVYNSYITGLWKSATGKREWTKPPYSYIHLRCRRHHHAFAAVLFFLFFFTFLLLYTAVILKVLLFFIPRLIFTSVCLNFKIITLRFPLYILCYVVKRYLFLFIITVRLCWAVSRLPWNFPQEYRVTI